MCAVRMILLIAAVVTVAGCGGDDRGAAPATTGAVASAETEERSQAKAAAPAAPRCAAGAVRTLRSSRVAYAALALRPLNAFREPGRGPFARFGLRNVNDVPTVFGVLSARLGSGCRAEWYRVQLPRKPNGITGYVRARDVELVPVRTRILVDLSERRVVLYRAGKQVLETTAAIGSAATPTPTGTYYVDQRLIPYDTKGPFGPGAVGIAAYSEVLTGWAQGGPIAIHGTNQPWSIGKAVSNGCIRVRNDVLRRLFAAVLPGTPVTIRL